MPEPLKRPIASQRTVRKLVRQYANLMGFGHPFKISVGFHDSRAKDYCDPKDPDCYACCEPQPQYHRCTLRFDLYHPRWVEKDESIDECIRHELGHALVALLAQAAGHLVGEKDERMRHVMGDLEDDLVQRVAAMPVWAYVEESE